MNPFQMGVIARRMGCSYRDNPYAAMTQQQPFDEWLKGWMFAHEGVLV